MAPSPAELASDSSATAVAPAVLDVSPTAPAPSPSPSEGRGSECVRGIPPDDEERAASTGAAAAAAGAAAAAPSAAVVNCMAPSPAELAGDVSATGVAPAVLDVFPTPPAPSPSPSPSEGVRGITPDDEERAAAARAPFLSLPKLKRLGFFPALPGAICAFSLLFCP